MPKSLNWVSCISALLLVACGGGGGGGSSFNQPTANQAMGGIWQGTGTNSLEPAIVRTIIALSTDDGEFRFITSEGVQSVGQASTSGSQLSGTSVDYAPLGEVFLNGQPVTTGSYAGTIVERQSIEGEWSGATGETGDFVLIYDDRHIIPSSLVTVSGTYTTYDEFDNPDGTVTIDGAGVITGSDIFGCIYGGNIQIIDSRFNVYRLNVTAANCGQFDGAYTGLAAYDPSDASLAYQIDNTALVITNEIYK